MPHDDDPPVATFRMLYALAAWGGLALLGLILTALVWTLFATTSAGTARSEELARVRPTVTAIAAAYAGVESGGTPVVELPATCAACHAIAGTKAQGTVGPELSHVGAVAAQRIAAGDYAGQATTAVGYVRESILEPSVYVVAGPTYGRPGASTMPAAVGQALGARELDQLVDYLASLK